MARGCASVRRNLVEREGCVTENEPVGPHHRLALIAVAVLLLALVAALPIGLGSTLEKVVRPTTGPVFVVATPATPSPFEYADIRVALVGLDEAAGFVTLRVSGYYTCQPPCAGSDRIVFASLDQTEDEVDRMPRSTAVTLSPTAPEVAQTVQLPVLGHALRYPFDSYELLLGISLQRVEPDGRARPLLATEAASHLRLTLRDAMPLFEMSAPVAIDPTTVRAAGLPYDYLHVQSMTFARSLDVQVSAVVAVCLIAAIAAFTVLMHPLRDLLLGAGGLILGVWGIRGLLVPSNITFTTLVDIGLGLVIGFLLAAITWRELLYLVERNHLRLPWSPTPLAPPAEAERPSGASAVSRGDDPLEQEPEPR
jgi:hypothetical protein